MSLVSYARARLQLRQDELLELTPREFWAMRRSHEDFIESLDAFQANIAHTIHQYAAFIKNKPRRKAADFMLTRRPSPLPARKRKPQNDTARTAA